MAKIVVAVADEEMAAQAENVVKAMKVDAEILHESSQTVVEAVRRQAELGAVVAVARGSHAHLPMRDTNIPVMEIVLPGQNPALLFSQAKALRSKPNPKIGLIGFRNMFGEMDILVGVPGVAVDTFFPGAVWKFRTLYSVRKPPELT